MWTSALEGKNTKPICYLLSFCMHVLQNACICRCKGGNQGVCRCLWMPQVGTGYLFCLLSTVYNETESLFESPIHCFSQFSQLACSYVHENPNRMYDLKHYCNVSAWQDPHWPPFVLHTLPQHQPPRASAREIETSGRKAPLRLWGAFLLCCCSMLQAYKQMAECKMKPRKQQIIRNQLRNYSVGLER